MAEAAAGAGGGAAEQEVHLDVLAQSADALEAFRAQFQPAEGFRCSLEFLPIGGQQQQQQQQQQGPAGSASPPSPGFDFAAYSAALSTRQLGQLLLHAPTIASTQDFMRRHSGALPEGSVLVAERQTTGKGRGGNVWTSPDGCLMFTAARRLKVPGSQAPFINYLVCLAVVRGIADASEPWLKGAAPDVSIKWPNDIYSGGLKIGGALIHTTWQGDRFSVLAGIGLNASNRQPTTCLDEVIERQLAAGGCAAGGGAAAAEAAGAAAAAAGSGGGVRVPRGALLAHVLNHLERCYDEFEASGFSGLEPAYLGAWMHSGQTVEVEEGAVYAPGSGSGGGGSAGPAGGGGRVRLRIMGLSESGFLLALDEAGGRWELTPDGNSLDMLAGLVRRKLP